MYLKTERVVKKLSTLSKVYRLIPYFENPDETTLYLITRLLSNKHGSLLRIVQYDDKTLVLSTYAETSGLTFKLRHNLLDNFLPQVIIADTNQQVAIPHSRSVLFIDHSSYTIDGVLVNTLKDIILAYDYVLGANKKPKPLITIKHIVIEDKVKVIELHVDLSLNPYLVDLKD